MRTSMNDASSSAITVEPVQEDLIQPNNINLNEETNLIHHEEYIENNKKSEKVYAYDKIRYVTMHKEVFYKLISAIWR